MTGFEVKAKANSRAEMFFYDAIGGDAFGGISASMVAKELRALGKVGQLDIYINSPGGSPFDGITIQNALRRNPARKRVMVDGIAASAASIIVMAGDAVEIASNGQMMIHDPWVMTAGNSSDLRETADKLDRTKAQILDTYMLRAKASATKIADMMAAETWLDPQEAVDFGFADTIVQSGAVVNLVRPDVLAKFRNQPRALTEPAAGQPEGRPRIEALRRRLKELGDCPAA